MRRAHDKLRHKRLMKNGKGFCYRHKMSNVVDLQELEMSPPTDRQEILDRFREQIKDGKPIIGAGAGTT